MSDPDAWLTQFFQGKAVAAGVRVNTDTAMHIIAVQACTRVLSETLASLPCILYKRLKPRGKERATDHRLYNIMHSRPNTEQTTYQFKEMLQHHVTITGNAYANIERDDSGDVFRLWPLLAHKMKPFRIDNKKWFEYTLPDGKIRILPSYKVLHIPGLSYDGLKGYDPIELAKQGLGLAIATEEYGARFFSNDARPGGVIQIPNKMKPEAYKRLKISWEEAHKDLENKHRIAILEEGAEFKETSMPPDHAQFLKTRQFTLNEIARMFRVQPHKIADLQHATYTNIEWQSMEFVIDTIRPWLIRWEQALTLQLLSAKDQEEYFFEFLIDALLRGDTETRFKAYRTGREMGIYSANDVLEIENKNPIPGGDKYYVPLNWVEAKDEIGDKTKIEEKSLKEIRSIRAAKTRNRIAHSYRIIFEEAALKIIRKEKRDIIQASKKYLAKRDISNYTLWLEEYYKKLPEYINPRMKPSYLSLGDAVKGEIKEELGINEAEINSQFMDEYITYFSDRYVRSSEGQIKDIINKSVDSGDDLEELILERLDSWEEKRPGKISMIETVQASNAFAKAIYVSVGITKLRWVTTGSKT